MTFDPASSSGYLPVPLAQAPESIEALAASLHFRPDPMKLDPLVMGMTTGVTLLAGVRECMRKNGYRHIPRNAKIFVSRDGIAPPEEIARKDWGTFLIRHGMKIAVSVPMLGGGGGGKNPLNTILSIVVMVAAVVVSALTQQWYLAAYGGTFAATMAGTMAGMAISIGGMLLVNAIAPISQPKLSSAKAENAEKLWSVDGIKNRADPYGPVPLILGKTRFAPRYFAQYYTYLNGKNQFARYLFGVMGHNKVTSPRIGDTDVAQFKGVRLNIHENWQGEKFEFFPAAVYQEAIGVTLTQASGWHSRTTAQDTIEIQWEVHSNGLLRVKESGDRKERTVVFQAEYRPVGTSAWLGAFGNARCNGGSIVVPAAPAPSYSPSEYGEEIRTTANFSVYSTASGNVSFSGSDLLCSGTTTSTWRAARNQYDNFVWTLAGSSVSVSQSPTFRGSVSVSGMTVYVSAGDIAYNEFSISGKTSALVRKGYSLQVPQGQYEFRLRRITENTSKDETNYTDMDDTAWPLLKSIKAGPVMKYDGTPYTIIELDIQASEQLAGHVDEFNAVFESYCPTWNGEEWVDAPSNNPAALCLMLATTPVIGEPVALEDLDLDSWQGLYEWCEQYGWKFNSVQTTQRLCGEVMHSILSAARGAVSVRNGRVGCVWDATDKPAGYPYGPRNSWGFKASKAFVEERAHGLRYMFINENRDYQEDERIVYADGYTGENATRILEAEQDGVTDPDLIYKHGRLRLADAEWRPEVYEFNTDYSFLCVQKGDRVPVTHDVPMWGLRQARVTDIVYADYPLGDMGRAALIDLAVSRQRDINHAATLAEFTAWLQEMSDDDIRGIIREKKLRDYTLAAGVMIDDIITMDAGKSYAFKWFPSSGNPVPYSVETEDKSTNILRFPLVIPAVNAPALDGLIHFGIAGQETHDCIVTAIETMDNLCAKIVCQDYSSDRIYAALTGPVPPWDSDITIPSRWKLGKPAAPSVVSILTNEAVLLRLGDGTLIPRIQISFTVNEVSDVTVKTVRVQYRRKDSVSDWQEGGEASPASGFIHISDVEELVEYEVRLYAVSTLGISSSFSPVYSVLVVGRTTPPPAPISVHIDGPRIWWEMEPDYPIDVRGWEVWMGFDADDPVSYAKRLTEPYVPAMEFDIARWSGWARRIWIRTVDDIGLYSSFVSVAVNLGDALVDNVVHEVLENSDRHWPGKTVNGVETSDRTLFPLSERSFWRREKLWASGDFWQAKSTLAMSYTTYFRIPDEGRCSWLSLQIDMPQGTLGSVEYRFGTGEAIWRREKFWEAENFWGWVPDSEWRPMPSKIWIGNDHDVIQVRFSTAAGSFGETNEMHWVFDVPDEVDYSDDLEVPEAGLRVPLTKSFRRIKNISFGQEYREGSTAYRAAWIDKGIIEDGIVVQGPLIRCLDINNNPTSGVVDVTMQGVQGGCHG